MNIYIITGASRGIGAAISEQLLSPSNYLICFSRTNNPNLIQKALEKSCKLEYLIQDLSKWDVALKSFKTLLEPIRPGEIDSISIIHNAGVLSPIKLIGKGRGGSGIYQQILINQFIPELLTEHFVAKTQNWEVDKKVLLISSGAARKPVPAWSTYCTTKAALDMYSRCLQEEQKLEQFPIKVVSLAPGVVDTNMQAEIRDQPKRVFPGVDRFLKLKAENALWTEAEAASHIITYLNDLSFGTQATDDIRNWLRNL